MDDAIKLIRAQMMLLTECLQELQHVKKTLVTNSNGSGVTEAAQAMEPTLAKLNKLGKMEEEFLSKTGKKRMTSYAASMSDSVERDAVMRLLVKVQGLETEMQKELASTRQLLKRSKEFVDFHINVITQTAANDTYAPPGATEVENRRGIKMFDANV